jgi:MFS family permease
MSASDSYQAMRRSLDDAPMSRAQIVAVALVAMIAAMDGFDVQAMAFVAPVVGKSWEVGRATMGLVLASSLFGMAGGAVLLSPLADIVGRRPAVLGGLALISLATFFSGMSQHIWQLAASRALTGLGIGMMVALTNTLAVEFSSTRRRSFSVATTIFGFSSGGLLGGLLSAAILHGHVWNWVFFSGTILGGLLFVLAFFFLPESPVFLMDRVSPRALFDLNKVLVRLGHSEVTALPVREKTVASLGLVFAPGTRVVAVRLAIVFILSSTAAFYVISWLPQLVTDAGFHPSTASLVASVSSLVGMVSALATGALGARVRPIILASVAIAGSGVALGALGLVPPNLTLLIVAAAVYGLFQSAGVASFYATLTMSFPPLARVSGIGFVMGLGRLASGMGPYAAGALFAAGWTRMSVSLVFAAAAIAAGLVLATGIRRKGEGAPVGKILPAALT